MTRELRGGVVYSLNKTAFRVHRTLSEEDNLGTTLGTDRVPQKWDVKVIATNSVTNAKGDASKKIATMSLAHPIQGDPIANSPTSSFGNRNFTSSSGSPTYALTSDSEVISIMLYDNSTTGFHPGSDFAAIGDNEATTDKNEATAVYTTEYGKVIATKFDPPGGAGTTDWKAFDADLIQEYLDTFKGTLPLGSTVTELYVNVSEAEDFNFNNYIGPYVEIKHVKPGDTAKEKVIYDVVRDNTQSPYQSYQETATTIYAHMQPKSGDLTIPFMPSTVNFGNFIESRMHISQVGNWYIGYADNNFQNSSFLFQQNPSLLLQRGYFGFKAPVHVVYLDSQQKKKYALLKGGELMRIYFPNQTGAHLHMEVRLDRTGQTDGKNQATGRDIRGIPTDPWLWIDKKLIWNRNGPVRVETLSPPIIITP
jgi:hypothetical protein